MAGDSSLAIWLPTKHFTKGNWKKNKITIHHTASVTTAEKCARGHMARTGSARASANYYIGNDGSCVQAVAEKDRSWCSGDGNNDCYAVTIEVSNSTGAPEWRVGEKALNKLVELCVDICKRNNIPMLEYKSYTDAQIYTNWATFKKQQYARFNCITLHKYFGRTACPGPFMQSVMPILATRINNELVKKPEMGKYVYGGLDYGLVFDPKFYKDFYQLPSNDEMELFNHFIQIGIPNLFVGCASFNIHCYAYYNPDLVAVYGSLSSATAPQYYLHYIRIGHNEPRRTC